VNRRGWQSRDNLVELVEVTYARTQSIAATMTELELPYKIVYECLASQRDAVATDPWWLR
jgi:hypothetical protein